MGQSASKDGKHRASRAVWAFRTELGWFGIAGCGSVLESLTFGHSAQAEVLARMQSILAAGATIRDCNPDLRRRLELFAKAGGEDFSDVATTQTETTPFAARVIAAVRRIPAGATRSYAELAGAAGSPRAARAVGNIMARNPIPIIIPCHRVTASGGRIGGYSAPRGLDMKRQLLALDAASTDVARDRRPARSKSPSRNVSKTSASKS
jgi:methylated-DNA-[protein]-cysteine S-methyltransferase